jgi:GntR family transcriptional repressor for pyruvate dehydrogenase complex
VDVRHGQGVFVREGSEGAGSFASWQAGHTYGISELLAFRLLVEPELAALAAERADDRFVDELTGVMTAMEAAAHAGDLSLLVRLDTAFHDAITRRAGNRLYRDMLDHVTGLLIDSRRISLSVPGRALKVVAAHNRVVAAIAARDPAEASRAMRAHLDKFAADMHIRPAGRGVSATP